MQMNPPLTPDPPASLSFIPANIVLAISAGLTRKEWSHSLSLGQGEVRGRILFSEACLFLGEGGCSVRLFGAIQTPQTVATKRAFSVPHCKSMWKGEKKEEKKKKKRRWIVRNGSGVAGAVVVVVGGGEWRWKK